MEEKKKTEKRIEETKKTEYEAPRYGTTGSVTPGFETTGEPTKAGSETESSSIRQKSSQVSQKMRESAPRMREGAGQAGEKARKGVGDVKETGKSFFQGLREGWREGKETQEGTPYPTGSEGKSKTEYKKTEIKKKEE